METLWVDPTSAQNPTQRKGSSLNRRFVRVASELQPVSSPAPPGHPIVPSGWVLQMGDEGEQDTLFVDTRSGSTVYRANITQPTVPLYTGGWPPDPLAGQSGHTPI